VSADILFKRRVALFQSLKFIDVCIVFQQPPTETDATYRPQPGYVRISEWTDVDFAPLAIDGQEMVKALNTERRAIVAESAKKLEDIDGRIIQAMAAPVKS